VSSPSNPRLATTLRIAALLAVYLLAGLAGRHVPFLSGKDPNTLLWLPSGIALAATLLFGWRYCLAIPAGMIW
jgi:hypothetical protein